MSTGSSGSSSVPEQPDAALARAISRRIAWHPWRLLLPAILFTLAIGSYLYQERRSRDDADFLARLDQQVLSALQVARMTARAAGDPDVSLELLRDRHRNARVLLENLYPPRPLLGLWPAPKEIGARLSQLDAEWTNLGNELEALTARQSAREQLQQALTRFQGIATRMLMTSDDLVVAMTVAEESPEQLRVAARQLMLIQRMLVNGERLLRGGKGRLTAADRFGRDAVLFGNVNNGLLNGNPELRIEAVTDEAARELLASTGRLFREASRQVQEIVRQSVDLAGLQEAVGDAARASDAIVAATREVELMYGSYVATRPLQPAHTRLLAGLAIATLLIAALLMAVDARAHRRNESQRRLDEFRRNEELEQVAATAGSNIRRVGDELTRLMADLGRVVQVETGAGPGEDPGEAVARGLKRVLAELHNRVDAIVTDAYQLAGSATSLNEATSKLNAAGRAQAQNVDKAANATQELASAVKLGYANIAKFDTLAESGVAEARAVKQQVGGALEEVESLATSVQESSRRVRRLLESADAARAVALRIDELSDHSKMLSLNVAIQITAHGGASRSNASFADELQRLAERARGVVQSVERMREGLRCDAEEAAKAIKHTAWAVKGAGDRLRKAEQPITNLHLIARKLEKFAQSQVASSQAHALRATEVVRAVTLVHASAGQSSIGAEAAASSAARLAELTASLQAHVSRLHPVLPEERPQERSVVALQTEPAAEESGRDSAAEDADERRRGRDRRRRRSGGLRPAP
ncbi:MAG: methyl-accepting chemotaxis protein [Gammaproteobacteria bacterium]|nr:MAG: methyl-accepting chemotaxis protein [Gammaproteobacteria bacterium]